MPGFWSWKGLRDTVLTLMIQLCDMTVEEECKSLSTVYTQESQWLKLPYLAGTVWGKLLEGLNFHRPTAQTRRHLGGVMSLRMSLGICEIAPVSIL